MDILIYAKDAKFDKIMSFWDKAKIDYSIESGTSDGTLVSVPRNQEDKAMKILNSKNVNFGLAEDIIREQVRKMIREQIGDPVKDIKSKLKELGFGNLKVPSLEVLMKDNKFVSLKIVKLDTKKLGAFAPVFNTIEADVKVGVSPQEDAHILIQYSWTHPRGSNGYTVQFATRNGKWEDRT